MRRTVATPAISVVASTGSVTPLSNCTATGIPAAGVPSKNCAVTVAVMVSPSTSARDEDVTASW